MISAMSEPVEPLYSHGVHNYCIGGGCAYELQCLAEEIALCLH